MKSAGEPAEEACNPPTKQGEEMCRQLQKSGGTQGVTIALNDTAGRQPCTGKLPESVEEWRQHWEQHIKHWEWNSEEWRQRFEQQSEEMRKHFEEVGKKIQENPAIQGMKLALNDTVGRQQRHKQRQEQIRARKIGYFTAQLDLTPEEAQAFWPVYNEYWEKRTALFIERNTLMRKVKNEKVDDKKALQIAQRLVENAQDDANLMREYHSKLEKILSPQKLLKYYVAEESFREELINGLRKR